MIEKIEIVIRIYLILMEYDNYPEVENKLLKLIDNKLLIYEAEY